MKLLTPDPDRAGFDPDRLANVTDLLDYGAVEGIYPGAVMWASHKGVTGYLHAAGHTDFSRTYPVDEHTLFDLASLTKPLATAASALLLLQDGLLHFGRTVPSFFPDRDLPHLRGVTLRHLLTHTSGLPAWRDLYSQGQSRSEAIDQLFTVELENEPGNVYTYSCLGYIMLGLVIESVCGEDLNRFSRRRVFEPMGMHSTGFLPDSGSVTRVAATDHCELRKEQLVGQVHDGNAYALGGVAGNAGLFASTADLALFCHSITDGWAAGRYLPFSLLVLRLMFANALPEHIGGQSIGWFMFPNDMLPGGDLVSKAAIGHSGFTGTAILIDSEYDVCAVLLSNRVCCSQDGTRFIDLRRRMLNALLSSIRY